MYSTLTLDVRDGVALLTLNRPEAMNTLSLAMGRDLLNAALACANDRQVRAVVLTGAGKAFCAGGDLRGMQESGADLQRFLLELTTHLHGAIGVFTQMDAPVIAAVNGTTAGAGVGLLAMADIAIAAQGTRITMAYTGVGLTPDGSTTFFLPRLVGVRRAAELMLTNRVLSAEEALDWGLLNQVVPDAEVVSTALALAQKLAAGPTGAYGGVKRMLAATAGALETQLALEARTISGQGASAEGREGIAAFLAKRKPDYRSAR
ncbi:MAG: enoyl-CoA hydratase/isomerase family protein [Steroidobacteraceae bacterium]